ncbi:disulfide bond formation protein DsbB [Microbacterium resistens]|uniref:Disulfide bond formation protein DsbB n=1 Tax=Microbacterium resistens TaxID=156977 RepID=A0ABU1SFV2_9MICO|nr:disulfide bond formation protein B [Microbacterium resistens]MDR6868481.1 disulfide bond formation protein DsbB [Microbacterium resistens]
MSTLIEAETPETGETSPRIIRLLSFWAHVAFIAGYLGILSAAMFWFQFAQGEYPCPLCILQRMAMMLVAIGPIYVVSQTLRGRGSLGVLATGAGIAILGSVLGMAMSGRQVLLHIAPGDQGYGTAVLGMHLYTWALVSFLVVLVFCGVVLAGGRWLVPVAPTSAPLRIVAWAVVWLFVLTIAINAVVVFAEAGWNLYLPDNPTGYRLFEG